MARRWVTYRFFEIATCKWYKKNYECLCKFSCIRSFGIEFLLSFNPSIFLSLFQFFSPSERLWQESLLRKWRNLPVWIYTQGISMLVSSWIRGRTLWKGYESKSPLEMTYMRDFFLIFNAGMTTTLSLVKVAWICLIAYCAESYLRGITRKCGDGWFLLVRFSFVSYITFFVIPWQNKSSSCKKSAILIVRYKKKYIYFLALIMEHAYKLHASLFFFYFVRRNFAIFQREVNKNYVSHY